MSPVFLVGSLFPQNPSDGEAFSHHFNLEYLEDSFVYNLIDNINTDKYDCVGYKQPTILDKRDILSDAVGEIVNGVPYADNISSDQMPKTVETVQKGRKRGIKLGYRSENSNDDHAL